MTRYFLIFLIFVACKNETSTSKVIPYDKMKAIIGDMVKAEEFVAQYVLKDTAKKHKTESILLYHKIFSIYQTNSKEFLNSFDYYLAHPKMARDMFDSLSVQSRTYLTPVKPAAPIQ